MIRKTTKKWTILIYADGNNEMNDTMYNAMLACKKAGSNKNINVIMQIGLINNNENKYSDIWSGVRRYYIKRNNPLLIEDLGKVNMADPNSLYKFIKWGMENYKAEQYMLILSGHGADFVGCLTDLSLNVPYIMGIPEMIKAINSIKENSKDKIDVLVLDMCYMNSIEIIYELGKAEDTVVKSMVTYTDYAPYEGLSYDKLIFFIKKYSKVHDLNLFLKYLIDNLKFNLTAFEINHKKLEQIKNLFNDLAYSYNNNNEIIQNPIDLINNLTPKSELPDCIKNINNKLWSIIIYSKTKFNGINNSIKITSNHINKLIFFYYKLAFAKNNYWTNLLSNISLDQQVTTENKIKVRPINSSYPVVHHILEFNSFTNN
ncbi:hypothetical protein CPJCM30710_07080 [Clostridium polyendosporum]|uniref:Clostripain n=1 Tax=Clostridium polyendosporum TaxID=69208 RepID=A0A919RXE1_9CLOT|nr:clostripain-related cysteine peptidase [Clostridium polyendosporum]GIM28042.1 hypothetical protein CPJCM30710_07080 [Clostridium polyendosporum]